MHEADIDELSLRDIVRILTSKRRLIGFAMIVSLAGALAYIMLSPKTYSSYAIVSVLPTNVTARLEDKIVVKSTANLLPETLKPLLQSQAVFVDAARILLEEDPGANSAAPQLTLVELSRKLGRMTSLSIEPQKANPQSGNMLFVNLSAQAQNPDEAAKIANAWAQAAVRSINRMSTLQLESGIQALSAQLVRAERNYREAEDAWAEFNASNPLELWKKELDSRRDQQVSLQNEAESIRIKIQGLKSRREVVQKQAKAEKEIFYGQPSANDLIFFNENLKRALNKLDAELKQRETAYQEYSKALEELMSQTPFELWKGTLSQYQKRLAEIELRLEDIKVEQAKAASSLATTLAQLEETPDRLVLQREVTSDPVATAAISGNLSALRDLVLLNETINDAHMTLLNRKNQLESALKALDKEKAQLESERAELSRREKSLRRQLVSSEAKKADLELKLQTARNLYQDTLELYSQYFGNANDVFFENSNPVYTKLQTSLLDLDTQIAQLQGQLSSINDLLASNGKAIQELKQKVARAETQSSRLAESLRLYKETYLALKQKKVDLDIELASVKDGQAQLLAAAFPKPDPVSPKAALTLALALVFGVMFGILLAFLTAALEEPADESSSPSHP
ncbi:GNVR domain-containing protein [Oceanithermus sp.]